MKFTGERFIPDMSLDKELEIEHLQRYYSVTDLVSGKKVVDAACGEGYGSNVLAEYANKVYGIDISEESIKLAAQKYRKKNLEFINGSIESLPFEKNSVDVVVSFETIEHVNEEIQHKFLKEVKRILKEDGILVISTPDKYIYSDMPNYKNEFHIKEFSKKEFDAFLKDYFKYIELYYQRFHVASVVGNDRSESLSVDLINGVQVNIGKYLVSVCCDKKNLKRIDSAVLDSDNRYQHVVNRIVELQEHVDEKNKHIKILQNELEQFKKLFNSQSARIEELINWANSLKEEIKKKDEITEIKTSEIKEKTKQIDILKSKISKRVETNQEVINQKDEVIKNQQAHIEQLLTEERQLNNILQSRGWKLLKKLYRFEDIILPLNSKRRFILKIIYRTTKNPFQILRNINIHKIKQFFVYLRNGDNEVINQKWNQFLDIYAPAKTKVEVIKPKQTSALDTLVFKKFKKPLVSIIIPVYNQWHYTYSCLKSVLEHTSNISYEIIIADDVSTDETVNILKYVENIIVIRNETNLGFLLNCNNAAKYAKGKYILFLNNDTNVQKDWLRHLLDLIEPDDNIGMVGSKLIYSDGRLQEAGGIIWKDASGWNYGRLDDPNKPEYNYVKEVDYISGASIMIRTELWKKIGGFDERYAPAYYEDSDLAFEVRKHGYKVVYQPKSVVVHFEGISHGTDTSSGLKSYQVKNREKFIEKWRDVLEAEHLENGQDVFLARDRSREKKTILVIDHYVPQYDKDAGSKTTFQYLKLFLEMELNVKFLGDNFYKHEPYTSALEKIGIEVLYGVWYRDNYKKWIKQYCDKIDYVYLNRPHISIKYIDLIKKYTKAKVIYYGHDLHFLRELREYELTRNVETLRSSEKWKKIEFNIFDKVDVVYYPSQVEIDVIKKSLSKITCRAIPAYIYDEFQDKNNLSFESKNDLLFVGGFSHDPNVDAVLWFANEIFPKVLEELPEIKFYVVGSNPPREIKELNCKNIIISGFVTDEQLENYYQKCRLVVVPLRYGAGVKGKIVEAMYFRVPVITTSVGAEGLNNINNYLMVKDDEVGFADMLIQSYKNIQLLNQLSHSYKEYIEKNFSSEVVKAIIKKDFH